MSVRVFKGANEITSSNLVGDTVLDAFLELSSVLNISDDDKARVNGTVIEKEAFDDHIIRDGDQVEFYKAQGEKG